MEKLLERVDERQLKLVGACMVILILAAAVTYGFLPQTKELLALRESRELLHEMNANQQDAQGEIVRLQQQLDELTQKLQGDMANLPVRQMEAFILGRLQTISWRNDIALVGVEPSVGESVEMYREVLFNVELRGEYFDLLSWLGEVSQELGFVVIKEFQLGIAEPDPQNPKLTTRLKLAAYRVLDDA